MVENRILFMYNKRAYFIIKEHNSLKINSKFCLLQFQITFHNQSLTKNKSKGNFIIIHWNINHT